MPRTRRRAWPTDTIAQRCRCMGALALAIYAPPILLAQIIHAALHALHH